MSRYVASTRLMGEPLNIPSGNVSDMRGAGSRSTDRYFRPAWFKETKEVRVADHPVSKNRIGLQEVLVLVVWATICAFYMTIALFGW